MPPDYRPLARRAAKKYGIPQGIFLSLVAHESGWNPKAGSPKNAVGLTQIHLPSHPDVSYEQATNPAFALDWGARYLADQYKRFGTWSNALAAYNAGPGAVESGAWRSYKETTNYVKNVLADAPNYKTSTSTVQQFAADPTAGVPDPATGMPASTAMPTLPDLTQQALAGLQTAGHHTFDAVAGLSDLTMSVAAQTPRPQPVASAPTAPGTPAAPAAGQPPPPATGSDPSKWLILPNWAHASGASEPGKPILNFAALVAQTAGTPFQVWDTTGHDKMTTNGKVSAHWSGNALDLPAAGAELIRRGRIALWRAGMPRAQAMKAGIGLYNIGRYQIIFGTNDPNLGGDHTDHLHVGIRGSYH